MSQRLESLAHARSLVGEGRLIAFLRAAKNDRYRDLLAVQLINDKLDRGVSLDAIFNQRSSSFDGDSVDYGYALSAESISEGVYRIHFGCMAGPDAGDGGSWVVAFDGDSVRSIDNEEIWIS